MEDLISVLIRSHNDEAFVEAALRAILEQESPVPFEVLSCDDASEDRTPEIIASFPEVLRLARPDGPYLPGRRLNYMIRQCRGNLVVFNNADAVPQNRHWLRNLTAPLLAGTADAVYANQLPRRDAAFLVRKDHLRAFGDGRAAAKWRFFFSLASAAAMREDLMRNPFDEEIRYSEDVEWAHRRSLRVVYAADALVEHSHNYTLRELSRRFYGEGYADGQIFGDRPALGRELLSAARETLRDALFLTAHPEGLTELPAAPVRRLCQRYSHWKGVRDYARDHA